VVGWWGGGGVVVVVVVLLSTFFLRSSSIFIIFLACLPFFFKCSLSSCVKIRLHTETQPTRLPRSALKVSLGWWGGGVVVVVVLLSTLSLPT
jgi:cobalamin synthase